MKFTRNTAVVFASCFAVVIGMVGASYAAVPLYYMFCRATGYGGTPEPRRCGAGRCGESRHHRALRHQCRSSASLELRARTARGESEDRRGQAGLFPRGEPLGQKPIVGHAAFNVAPDNAARYFNKIQCFCFTEQRLEAGESVEMPVSFFVSPAILKDRGNDTVTEITLSYTFYPATNQKTDAKTASVPAKGSGG